MLGRNGIYCRIRASRWIEGPNTGLLTPQACPFFPPPPLERQFWRQGASVILRDPFSTTESKAAAAASKDFADLSVDEGGARLGPRRTEAISLKIPQRKQHKEVTASDAVSLVSNGDTVCCSGFVGQGSPEAILKVLGERYEETGSPHSLTLLFGGGPGDWDSRGLNHLAKGPGHNGSPPMLRRTIGSHYGQVPRIASLAVSDSVEAWTLPLGSISRMVRAQATHSPGHITTVGLGTYVDPHLGTGGAANASAATSTLQSQLVSKILVQGHEYLMYKALPIDVAIIRATTADAQGNLSFEHESLLCDQMSIAMGARNSGGLVIAQVKRLCEVGSLPARSVAVPGPLVDCVVVVDDEDHAALHPMSYESRHDPVLTSEIRTPKDEPTKMPLTERKVIARRASMALKPGKVVNLGIGLPEGVASVATEEGMLEYVTLTTEAGVFGGMPASGRNFGPGANADALVEMNEMFDFYDGGGLDMSFLGAAQVGKAGDVNVSRMSNDVLIGPGGFIDISQSTGNICFMCTFTAKGLKTGLCGDGRITIETEGKIKKFVPEVLEKTFSGDEAVRRGQKVYYVTERAVFRRTAKHDIVELVEIAPGIDLQKDVLDRMDFVPAISSNLKLMDRRIFLEETIDLRENLFGSLEERCVYHEFEHTIYVDLFGLVINTAGDIKWFTGGLRDILGPYVEAKGPIHVIANYNGFDLRHGLEDTYSEEVAKVQQEYYASVKRYTGKAFRHAKLGRAMEMMRWDPAYAFDEFDKKRDGVLSKAEFREGMKEYFGIVVKQTDLEDCFPKDDKPVDMNSFPGVIHKCLTSSGKIPDDRYDHRK